MKYAFWALLLAGLVAIAVWYMRDQGTPQASSRPRSPIPVNTVLAEQRDFRDEVAALGSLRAWESVDISASVSQIVTEINFEDGQSVEKGTVLALLKQDAEQATLRELQASQADARREVRRLVNLAKQNQVAQTDLDKARTLEQITRHQIEEIQARIADRTIVAPFSGVLGLRQVSTGALVTPGQRLTTLDDLSRMRLQFSVPATLLAFIKPGQSVEATTPAFEQVFPGTISALDSRVDPISRAITVRAVLDNPGQVLRPGLLMEVLIKGPPRQALLVPEESLVSRSTSHYLWRVEGQTARRIEVGIGGRSPGWVEITGGLKPGDRVVRDGVGRLSGDQAVVAPVES